ncbi:MAG: glycoside hydrolase family 20 zincin-like fold domain-containing protein [Alistipes sp.]|nr:glycoside hydrolase family 20 zincin-like fold domain-containing protein [Alistipes sp.]
MGLAGLFAAGLMLFSCSSEVKEANYQIIPIPQEIVMGQGGAFTLANGTKVLYPEGNEKMQKNAQFLADYVKELTGNTLSVEAGTDGKGIVLQVTPNEAQPEGYQLKVSADKVVINGGSEAGVFYGIQTLRKSIPAGQGINVSLPAVEINDAPRFSYRGGAIMVRLRAK